MKLTAIIAVLASIKKSHEMFKPIIFIFVLLFVGVVQAQSLPFSPVRISFTYSPSDSSPPITHLVGQKLGEFWDQPVVIEVEKIKHAELIKDNNFKVE